jgi:hypothetical protein
VDIFFENIMKMFFENVTNIFFENVTNIFLKMEEIIKYTNMNRFAIHILIRCINRKAIDTPQRVVFNALRALNTPLFQRIS